jgi:HJR/Mrr/RecB family endonuclease
MAKVKDQYSYGRAKEEKVARSLRNKGASVSTSKGSKGAADLVAKFPSGTKWAVQVKSTRSGSAAMPSTKDMGRLKQVGSKSNSTAVVARVSPKGIEYKSARSGRTLAPPSPKGKK